MQIIVGKLGEGPPSVLVIILENQGVHRVQNQVGTECYYHF